MIMLTKLINLSSISPVDLNLFVLMVDNFVLYAVPDLIHSIDMIFQVPSVLLYPMTYATYD